MQAATARKFWHVLKRAWRIKPRVPRRLVLRQVLDYRAWRRSLSSTSLGPLETGLPWMTFPAIRFLSQRARPEWRVFEYGSGGSSLFLADRVAELISVEHDAAWVERFTAGGYRAGRDHWSLRLEPPECAAPPDHADVPRPFASGLDVFVGQSFERYCRSIEAVASTGFDLIVVDGRARSSCLALAAPALRHGGLLLLDDSQRNRYQPAMARLDRSFVRFDFPGSGPRKRGFSRTTVWQRIR